MNLHEPVIQKVGIPASVQALPPNKMYSAANSRWLSGLFLIGICSFVVFHFLNSLWTTSIDVALHYALVARISEHWHLPTGQDPSLEEMNVYPRYSHRLAAVIGNLVASPMAGMQFVAMLSLAVLWSGFGFIFWSLPRRLLWFACGSLIGLLLANRLIIHLELFGNELLGNYFFPQLAAQAMAIALLAIALWMERAGVSPVLSYLALLCWVPIIPQFHLVPAVEVLGIAILLVAVNVLDARNPSRWKVFFFGLFAILASLLISVRSPAFQTMLTLSANNGTLELKYTPNLADLAIESGIVIAFSALLVWQWMRLESAEARMNGLAIKYMGIFGLAVGGLCLAGILMQKLGYGSEYGCKKYAFALNTLLVLDIPLLLIILVAPLKRFLSGLRGGSISLPAILFQRSFVGIFVLAAFLTIFPPTSARAIAVDDIVRAEHFAMQYRERYPGSNSGKYDYAVALLGKNTVFDYLISIGALRAPRANNADDFLNGRPPTKPDKVGRIFTRAGSMPWDVHACRELVTQDGFAILDASCVFAKLNGPHPGNLPAYLVHGRGGFHEMRT